MDNVIGRTELTARLPSGETRRIVIEISSPRQTPEGWVCEVMMQGIDAQAHEICGQDTFQALSLAMWLAKTQLHVRETVNGWAFELEGLPHPWRTCWGEEFRGQ